MTLASRGEHTKHPKVIYAKAKSINISSFTDMQLNVDGIRWEITCKFP